MAPDADSFSYIHSSTGVLVCTAFIIALLTLCCIFSICGYCTESASVNELKHCSENNKKIQRALKIKNNSYKYGLYFRTGSFVSLALITFLSDCTYVYPLRNALVYSGLKPLLSDILSVLAVMTAVLVLTVTLCRFVPQKISSQNPEKLLVKYSGFFLVCSAVVSPLSILCSAFTDIIVRISGLNTNKNEKTMTEEKILMMVDEGEENGMIEENTKSMIENVFDFDDTTVKEIMTHRKEIVAVPDNCTAYELTQQAIESGYSRIPVYHGEIDNIIGIIYVKDLLKFINTSPPADLIGKDMLREAVFVPESKRCSEMFEYMTSNKTQIAVVVDEFGGTGGIITMEDLIESIVGNIQDEYDDEEEDIKKVNEYSFNVDGATSLDEISDLTGIDFDDEQNDTIAGVMLDRMGHIPKDGEHPSIMINGTRFTVLEIDNRRISKVLVVKKNKTISQK